MYMKCCFNHIRSNLYNLHSSISFTLTLNPNLQLLLSIFIISIRLYNSDE
ncbi:hypothetical protein M8C21_028396 [Ambrosia artemisiifolia]|uniref:Uncharacterized protein n=1 Tax=Ambrosia artemisiifolia TaxID=4212 RepID=A0AAD5BTU1_AMBAR|nr:hypothetical protein M8C21_028396 [Ambrosia artemisiifolia]